MKYRYAKTVPPAKSTPLIGTTCCFYKTFPTQSIQYVMPRPLLTTHTNQKPTTETVSSFTL